MNASEYFVTRTHVHTLHRRIGERNFALVSDARPDEIDRIHRNIAAGLYPSERELFADIYEKFGERSIIPRAHARRG